MTRVTAAAKSNRRSRAERGEAAKNEEEEKEEKEEKDETEERRRRRRWMRTHGRVVRAGEEKLRVRLDAPVATVLCVVCGVSCGETDT